MKKKFHTHTLTIDLVFSMRAMMLFFRSESLAGASVKTKISEKGGAAVRASCQSYAGQKKRVSEVNSRLVKSSHDNESFAVYISDSQKSGSRPTA